MPVISFINSVSTHLLKLNDILFTHNGSFGISHCDDSERDEYTCYVEDIAPGSCGVWHIR